MLLNNYMNRLSQSSCTHTTAVLYCKDIILQGCYTGIVSMLLFILIDYSLDTLSIFVYLYIGIHVCMFACLHICMFTLIFTLISMKQSPLTHLPKAHITHYQYILFAE